MKHPYIIGLEIGWKDDALNIEGHKLLTRLSEIYEMETQKIESLEMEFVESLPLISKGIGNGELELRKYVEDIEKWFPQKGSECAQYLGRRALDVGLTKQGWKDAYEWMISIGLGIDFANGAWMEGNEPQEIELPSFFDDIVSLLGL